MYIILPVRVLLYRPLVLTLTVTKCFVNPSQRLVFCILVNEDGILRTITLANSISWLPPTRSPRHLRGLCRPLGARPGRLLCLEPSHSLTQPSHAVI
jgi:hypothetical protein